MGRIRVARSRANGGSLTIQEWEDICDSWDYRCAWGRLYPEQARCDGSVRLTSRKKDTPPTEILTIGHVLPIKQGGTTDANNIVPLCLSCNCSQNGYTLEERLNRRGKC